MYEYAFFDGDHFITFDIVEIDDDNEMVTIAVSNQGRITQDTFKLHNDYDLDKEIVNDIRYFEYGLYQKKIYLSDFELL